MDTWLEQKDIDRLFDVAEGKLPEYFTSKEELIEFQRLIDNAVEQKKNLGYNKKTNLH